MAAVMGSVPPGAERFATTHWSNIRAAAGDDSTAALQALGDLCRIYWYPLYAFARRGGSQPHDAQDLVQGFFTRLLEKGDLGAADPAKGRFRSYLLGCFRHYCSNVRDYDKAARRGGGRAPLSLESGGAEARYGREASSEPSVERAFDRAWALTLLERVLVRLKHECEVAGKLALFERLRPGLAGGGESTEAPTLGMTEGAIKVAAHRMRLRYRELLREEVARTVADPGELDLELQELIAALRP